MINIKLFNKISKVGIAELDAEKYCCSEDATEYDAVLVRSAALHDTEFPKSLKAIARAGAGVNNIPIDRMTDEGIAVFNTPGANANAVKELAICALLLASRGIYAGITWAKGLKGTEDVAKQVEKGKSAFAGTEIIGKTLGVIGLGAIGGMLCNAALALGMKVIGCDPYLSVNAALALDPRVKRVATFEDVYKESDYISIHVPSTPQTKGMINKDSIALMKDSVRIINIARGDLCVIGDISEAMDSGKVAAYVTDFPTEESVADDRIITMPHLGASTAEAEDNCAVMAARELIGFLENGDVVNSVNFPCLSMPRKGERRVTVLARGNADIVNAVTSSVSVCAVDSAVRGELTYVIADTNSDVDIDAIAKTPGVIKATLL